MTPPGVSNLLTAVVMLMALGMWWAVLGLLSLPPDCIPPLTPLMCP